MAFKKEEFQALIEREGVADFIWARSFKDVEGTNVGIYELINDRYGCVFQIYPPVYVGPETEKILTSFFNNVDLPDKSSIQFFAFASRNLTMFRQYYKENHSTPSDIEYDEVLLELRDNREEWIKKHANKSIYQKGNDLRLRNMINLVCITIPKYKKGNIEYTESEIVSMFSKIEQGLNEFSPRKFTKREWVALMREIIIPDNPMWYPPDDNLNLLNYQVVNNDSTLILEDDTNTIGLGTLLTKDEFYEKNKELFLEQSKKTKIDEDREEFAAWHAKVLTTKLFPQQLSLFQLVEKFYDFLGKKMAPTIPCPFFISLIVYFEGREKIKREVDEKVKWNLWQTESLGKAVRFFPEIRKRAEEAEIINHLLHEGESPLYASWSVCLMDESILKVNDYSEILKTEFLRDNWILQEEKLIGHWLFLYHLPLNFEPYVLKDLAKRMNTLFNQNAAAITPVVTGEKGFGTPVLNYVDRIGQIFGVDIFASPTNYNFIVVGSSGSGKSYSMADFFANYLMNGAKIRVIDVGRSYKDLCNTLGGQYIEFTEEANICLNFFTNIQLNKQGQIHEDELQTLVPLVALMAMQSVHPDDVDDLKKASLTGYISKAITEAFKKRQREAGMQDVLEALKAEKDILAQNGETNEVLNDLIVALYPFGDPDGEYYKYFNGENNLKFTSDFVILELEEIDSKEQLKSVVLAAIAHTINTEFFLGSREQRKILAIDEAWSIMDNKIVVRFLETMARRIRKYNGASGIITQTIADFYKNKATRAIFDSSAWKFFLQQSKESIQAAEKRGELTLDDGLIALLKTVKSKPPYYSEILIKQDTGAYFIGRLITDRVAHWIYTNHPSDMKVVREIMRKFGVSELDAKLIQGYAQSKGITIEEEYRRRLKEGKLIKIK